MKTEKQIRDYRNKLIRKNVLYISKPNHEQKTEQEILKQEIRLLEWILDLAYTFPENKNH